MKWVDSILYRYYRHLLSYPNGFHKKLSEIVQFWLKMVKRTFISFMKSLLLIVAHSSFLRICLRVFIQLTQARFSAMVEVERGGITGKN